MASSTTDRAAPPHARRGTQPSLARGAWDRPRARAKELRIGGEARSVCWLAVIAFVGTSVWWLTQDDRVPDYDSSAARVPGRGGPQQSWPPEQLTRPFTDYTTYPPLVHIVGALGVFVAGLHPMALILTSNIVFVPLLAFGCYGTAAGYAYGPRAGLLAAVLALGSPMIVSTMHEYYLDAPQAAMIAVSVWALLASRHFERVGIAALAGALSGLALMTKETSVVFLAGIVIVAALRAGRGRRQGVLAYALAACVVARPWYVYHAARPRGRRSARSGTPYVDSQQSPPRFSLASFELVWLEPRQRAGARAVRARVRGRGRGCAPAPGQAPVGCRATSSPSCSPARSSRISA